MADVASLGWFSDIHVSDPDAQAESGLTCADQKLIIGALEYKDKLCALHTHLQAFTIAHVHMRSLLLEVFALQSPKAQNGHAASEAHASHSTVQPE